MDNARETSNIGYTRRRKTKQKHNTICVGHHYAQTNTNNVNKIWFLLQTAKCHGNYYLSNKEIFFKSIFVVVIAHYQYYTLITNINRQLIVSNFHICWCCSSYMLNQLVYWLTCSGPLRTTQSSLIWN